MTAYYNEFDPYAAQWLRNLIAAGHIAPGEVDERGIEDVKPDDLNGFTQCHFFAGIGIWSRALRDAGWSDDRAVWTASCPCQPFSESGERLGFNDERHLWPALYNLIQQHEPSVIFGEQVAKATEWLGLVHCDLDGLGYAFGCVPIEAASAGAFHFRERLFFVADTDGVRRAKGGLPVADSSFKVSQAPTNQPCNASAFDVVECLDGRSRPIEPGTRTLVDAYPRRVDILRAYGNALDLGAATEFITAYMEC